MINEPRSYELEAEMVKRLDLPTYYGAMQSFAKTARKNLNRRHFRKGMYSKNLWIQLDGWGNPEVILHNTIIVRFLPHQVRLSHGGWSTQTTKKWINDFLLLTEFNYIFQEDYSWRMVDRAYYKKVMDLRRNFIIFQDPSMTESQRRKHNKELVTNPIKKLETVFQNDMLVNYNPVVRNSSPFPGV